MEAYEDDIFYDSYGMRVWEKRHALVSELLEKHNINSVKSYFVLLQNFCLSYTLIPFFLSFSNKKFILIYIYIALL